MEIDKLLSIDGIFKGNSDLMFQYYQVLLHDQDGKNYLGTVGTKLIYVDSVEKTFGRLLLVPAPRVEETTPKDGEPEDEGVIVVDELTSKPEVQTELYLETKENTEGADNVIRFPKG